MTRRLLLSALTLAAFATPVATAQDPATKAEVVDQSGAICRDALDAIETHIREVNVA